MSNVVKGRSLPGFLRRGLVVLTLACATLVSGAATAENTRIGDFALLDHQGKHLQLSYFGDHAAVVIGAHKTGSAAAAQTAARLTDLSTEHDDVVFWLLNASDGADRAAIAEAAAEQSLALPVLLDEAQLVSRLLGLSHVGEVAILLPESLQVAYTGPADDSLAAALEAVVAGELVASVGVNTGEAIPFEAQASSVSYSKDIAPILTENCVSCHHDGGVAPWSMSGYDIVRGWSPMMKEVVMTRRMPPGQIDHHVGREIMDVAELTVAEQQTLVSWIDAGAPKDEGEDPLAKLTFQNPKFTLGEPDLVYQVAPQTIPATGVIDYRYVPVQLNLDRDVWVRAMEFVPGDRQVLHHVIAYLSSPSDRTVRGRETGAARGDSVGGFAPGRQPDQFRDNSGRLIKKGSNLLLQMHYTTSGRETVDATEVGIYLYDEPPAHVMSGGVAGQRRFLVPPGAKEHRLSGEQEIERDAYLYELNPHMHYRGKYMSYTAEYPDGSSEVLLSVPKYDFNWQFNYVLKEPAFLPAGTKLIANGAMDNSDRNPYNPDPTKPVHFGLQTKHEMFFGFTTLRYVGDTPQNIANKDESKAASTGEPAGR